MKHMMCQSYHPGILHHYRPGIVQLEITVFQRQLRCLPGADPPPYAPTPSLKKPTDRLKVLFQVRLTKRVMKNTNHSLFLQYQCLVPNLLLFLQIILLGLKNQFPCLGGDW